MIKPDDDLEALQYINQWCPDNVKYYIGKLKKRLSVLAIELAKLHGDAVYQLNADPNNDDEWYECTNDAYDSCVHSDMKRVLYRGASNV